MFPEPDHAKTGLSAVRRSAPEAAVTLLVAAQGAQEIDLAKAGQ
jgi:hypothetical protein